MISDAVFHRSGKVRFARLPITFVGFTGALIWLLPVMYVEDRC